MGIKKRDKGSDYMREETKGITGGFGDKRKNYSIIFKEKKFFHFQREEVTAKLEIWLRDQGLRKKSQSWSNIKKE